MRNFYNNIKNGNIIFLLNGNAIIFILLLFFTAEIQPKSGNLLIKAMTSDSLTNKLVQINAAEYVWNIDNTDSWNDLHTFLPSAKMAGIAVWIKLLPPSKVPQYSEPFKTDYIRWSEEIAKLSLRYSNLKGYSIQELQLNIDQGYFTQSYIDNMKTKGVSINPKLKFIITDKTYKLYYVDKDAKGNGDGTSWTNAATALSNLNWKEIGKRPNDTVYVSGGTNSKMYPGQMVNQYPHGFRNYIVTVAPGKDAGHNGKVAFSNSDVTKRALQVSFTSRIHFTGFIIESNAPIIYPDQWQCISMVDADSIGLNNCHVISDGRTQLVYASNCVRLTITDNIIETLPNMYPNDQDGIQIYSGGGGHTIRGNKIIMRAADTVSVQAHHDGIQFGGEGQYNNYETIIANNFIYYVAKYAKKTNAGLYLSNVGSNRFLIYNNIIVLNTTSNRNIVINNMSSPEYNVSVKLFNNTLVNGSPIAYGVWIQDVDSLVMLNNIISLDNAGAQYNVVFGTGITYKEINYNQYFKGGSYPNNIIYDQKGLYYDQWQSLGFDTNSNVGAVGFKNSYGMEITDYEMINQIGNGTDLSIYFNTDIRGYKRPLGVTWDRGALEK